MPKHARKAERPPGPAPTWSGTLSFGLVSVPVDLYPAHRAATRGLRLLGPGEKPLTRRYYCEKDGHEIGSDHLVRGFEIEPGKHVVVTDEELDRLAPAKSRDIELKRFVDAESLDPVAFDRPYFLTPGSENAKAYRLLASVMERTARAGIATFVMHGKERLVAILSQDGILRAETLRFHDEIRNPEEAGLPERAKPDPKALHAFEKLIASHAKAELAETEMVDPRTEALRKLVEKKKRHGERVVLKEADADDDEETSPVDLVEVLRRSLGRSRGRARPRAKKARSRARARAS